MASAAHPLIANLELHDDLSEEEKDVLLSAIGPEREVSAGTDMIRQGDRLWHSTVLLSGFAIRYQIEAKGRRQITAIHVPGDFIDLHSFLLKTMDHSVAGLSACTYATVSHDALKEITATRPHLTRLLWLKTVIDCAILRKWCAVTGGYDPYHRIAYLICELFVRLRNVGQTEGRSFQFPLPKTDFGDVLGLTAIQVDSIVMQLCDDGLTEWRSGVVTISEWDRLKDVAQFDRTYLSLHHEPR
jgi:CRP-like cAMP-binding protein